MSENHTTRGYTHIIDGWTFLIEEETTPPKLGIEEAMRMASIAIDNRGRVRKNKHGARGPEPVEGGKPVAGPMDPLGMHPDLADRLLLREATAFKFYGEDEWGGCVYTVSQDVGEEHWGIVKHHAEPYWALPESTPLVSRVLCVSDGPGADGKRVWVPLNTDGGRLVSTTWDYHSIEDFEDLRAAVKLALDLSDGRVKIPELAEEAEETEESGDYRTRGLIPNRYQVLKGDGSPTEQGSKYFVLRYDKNDSWGMACRVALSKLCAHISGEYPKLAEELKAEVVRSGGSEAGAATFYELPGMGALIDWVTTPGRVAPQDAGPHAFEEFKPETFANIVLHVLKAWQPHGSTSLTCAAHGCGASCLGELMGDLPEGWARFTSAPSTGLVAYGVVCPAHPLLSGGGVGISSRGEGDCPDDCDQHETCRGPIFSDVQMIETPGEPWVVSVSGIDPDHGQYLRCESREQAQRVRDALHR